MGQQKKIYFLCLSDNNHHNDSEVRKQELLKSAASFGVKESDVFFGGFKDNDKDWQEEEVIAVIDKVVEQANIETIITFDEKGASGHHNHCITSQYVQNYVRTLRPELNLYLLRSKDDDQDRFSDPDCPRYHLPNYKETWFRMLNYKLQFTWYRKLQVPLSRFSYSNTLKKFDNDRLLRLCSENKSARILIRYPRGHMHDDLFLKKFQEHAEILYSKTLTVTQEKLNSLLYEFYYNVSELRTKTAIARKCTKIWDSNGKITIFVFRLRNNKTMDDDHLKDMKKEIRMIFGTIHSIHTSDDHEETINFSRALNGT